MTEQYDFHLYIFQQVGFFHVHLNDGQTTVRSLEHMVHWQDNHFHSLLQVHLVNLLDVQTPMCR